MKKLVVFFLAICMIASLGLSAMAIEGGFISSPSGNPAPRIRRFVPSNTECTAELTIVPYAQRDVLPADAKAEIESAYDAIKATKDPTTLSDELKDLAAQKQLVGEKLAFSDLFDLHVVGCDETAHEEHRSFTIELEADTLKHFVALMHLDNGQWDMIENAKVEGNVLSFQVDDFSPFAIVVDTSADGPDTGDNSHMYFFAAMAVLSAAAAIFCWTKARKLA